MKNIYFLFIAIIFAPIAAFSQGIQVVEVNKTFKVGDTYELSIKNDGEVDLIFKIENNSKGNKISIANESAMHSVAAAEMNHFTEHGKYAIGFKYEDRMGDEWVLDDENPITLAQNYGEHKDNFKGKGRRFIGTKHKMAGGNMFHYGWIEVDVSDDASTLKIVEYAFNAAHNGKELYAGEKDIVDGVNELAFENNFQIVSTNNGLEISNLNSEKNVVFQLFDLTGKVMVTHQNLVGGKNLFSTSGFSKGIYLVSLRSNDKRLVKKVYIP